MIKYMNPQHMVKLHAESVDLYVKILQHKDAKTSLFLRAVKRERRRYKTLYSLYVNNHLSFSDLYDCKECRKHAEKYVNTLIFS